MIKLLLAALLFLNVSLANVEIADEGEDIDYDKQDDMFIEKTVDESKGLNIEKKEGTEEQSRVIRQFIDTDKKQKRERARDKFNYKIAYEKWNDDSEHYKTYKEDLFKKMGWTLEYTKFWGIEASNVGQMSADKYAQYIQHRNGTFMGANQTWVILIGTSIDNATQDVAREMNILARKFKRAKKTTYRWDFVDYILDEQLA